MWIAYGATMLAFLFAAPTDLPAEDKPLEAQQAQTDKTSGEKNSVELGVIVAASPGRGMLVVGVKPESAADDAGIRVGDYILEVGGKELSSPKALQQEIASKRAGDDLMIRIWRRGHEKTLTAALQARVRKRKTFFRGEIDGIDIDQRPWLGVLMKSAEQGGVRISRVYLDSPAAKAGLKPGDRIVRVGKSEIELPADVAHKIKQLKPGDEIEITIERNDEEQTLTVAIGNLGDFHERLFGDDFRGKFLGFHELLDPDFDGFPEIERLRLHFHTPNVSAEETGKDNSTTDKPSKKQ
jgi:C-terminal processing protease CtpA/Prc